MTLREKIEQHNPDAVFLSQYGDAIVGMTLGDRPVAVYDFDLMVACFRKLPLDQRRGAERCGGVHRQELPGGVPASQLPRDFS
jgi:hypothetical protein